MWTAWRFLEMLNIAVTYDPMILFLGLDPERIVTCAPRCLPQHYYHSPDTESTNMTTDREMKTTLPSFFSQEYYSALEQNN